MYMKLMSVWGATFFQAYFLMKEGAEVGIGTKGMEKNLEKGVKAVPRIRSEISYFGKTFDFFE